MCELLIAFQDKVDNTNPNYAANYLQGDVITAQDDGWPWSQIELTNSAWRIIKVPGVPLTNSTVQAITKVRTDPTTGALIRRRDYVIDVSLIPSTVKQALLNNHVVTLTTQQAQQIVTWVRQHSAVLTES